jgi:hypothetical protein
MRGNVYVKRLYSTVGSVTDNPSLSKPQGNEMSQKALDLDKCLAQFKKGSGCYSVGSGYGPLAATGDTVISLRCP